MINNLYHNQTLETAQLTNPNQKTLNLNTQAPQMGPTNLQQAAQPYNNPPPNGLNNTSNVSPTIGVNPNKYQY